MSDLLKYSIELVAVLLLALGIKGLSKVRSAVSYTHLTLPTILSV